jgi:hypothetical protein
MKTVVFAFSLLVGFSQSRLAAQECADISGSYIGSCKIIADPLNRFPRGNNDITDIPLKIDQKECALLDVNGSSKRVGVLTSASSSNVLENPFVGKGASQSNTYWVNQRDRFVSYESIMATTWHKDIQSATVTSTQKTYSKLNENVLLEETLITSGFSKQGASIVECRFEKQPTSEVAPR